MPASHNRLDQERRETDLGYLDLVVVQVEIEVLLAEEAKRFERLRERAFTLGRREIANEGQTRGL
jgi:hypothetical protein